MESNTTSLEQHKEQKEQQALRRAAEREISSEKAYSELMEYGRHLDQPYLFNTQMTTRRHLIEEHLKIRNKDSKLRYLTLNRCQLECDAKAGKRNIVLKARQVGITTYVAARFLVSTITQPGTLSVQVAHDQQSAEQIFRIVHRFVQNLPDRWRNGPLKTSFANKRQIVFPTLDSEYRVETAADPCAGRGLTIQNLHCSEVSRWPRDVAETLSSLRAAVPPDGEIFLESTADGAWGSFYEEWQSAKDTGYVQHFFPWWYEPSYRRKNVEIASLSEEEAELMQKFDLSLEQIAFRREVKANFRNRAPAEFAEYAETCFLTSGNCIFDCEMLDARLRKPESCMDMKQNGQLLYFLPPAADKDYVIGVDPASGDPDGDYSCIQVIDYLTGAQCAEWHGHCRPDELASYAAELGKQYNFAVIAVERNGVGLAALSHLGVHTDYPNIYKANGATGWATTKGSRDRALATLESEVTHRPDSFTSHRLLQECRTFVRKRDGRCEAAPGAHDDCVMAMAIAHAVRSELRCRTPEGKNGKKAA